MVSVVLKSLPYSYFLISILLLFYYVKHIFFDIYWSYIGWCDQKNVLLVFISSLPMDAEFLLNNLTPTKTCPGICHKLCASFLLCCSTVALLYLLGHGVLSIENLLFFREEKLPNEVFLGHSAGHITRILYFFGN